MRARHKHLSFDRLAGLVRELGGDPRRDALYMFHNRRRTHLKLLWHAPRGLGGYTILSKRLDRGVYRVPLAIPPGAKHVVVSRRELELLLEGIDSALLRAARRSLRRFFDFQARLRSEEKCDRHQHRSAKLEGERVAQERAQPVAQ